MLEKLLITGAAGSIFKQTRDQYATIARSVRLSDVVEVTNLGEGEEFVPCDLSDQKAVEELVEGCDGILNLGGISTENTFKRILESNIVGIHNLYEAARKHGSPRIFMASSNHVVGYYRQDEHFDASVPHKPDGWYGISKSFGEAVALMYFNKFGIETAMVRIGSILPEPLDYRMLATWFAPEDFISLVKTIFEVPHLGCPVIYGISNNDAAWWDNSGVDYLGWKPKRNSAEFAEKIGANVPVPDKDDPVAVWQGGKFTADPVFE